MVEQGTENPRVVGSIPTGGTIENQKFRKNPKDKSKSEISHADLAHLVERDLAKVEVAGSSPVIRSIWEFSSAGRASALQAEGQEFEPLNSHHFKTYGSVVQLVRALACHARGHGFEPRLGRDLW